MAKVKAKTQKKPAKAKPSAKKKGAAKAKAPAGKARKPAAQAKAVKKAPEKPAPKKVAPKPAKTPSSRPGGKAPAKPVAKKTAKTAAPEPKAAAPVKKPATVSKTAPAKPQPKAAPVRSTPAAKPVAPAKPAPKAPAPPPAPKSASEKPAVVGKSAPVKAAETPTAPATTKKEPAPKAAPTKEAKPKPPIIAVMTGVEPIGLPARTLKRAMKERFSVEFYMNATPGSLYDMISTPSGLSEWFCDDVDVRGDQFTFRWGNDDQTAQCLSRKFGELMRFQWEDDEDQGAYFELRIRIDPMTNETCLVVTDHSWPKDMDEAKALWGSQIHTLQRVLGA
jgi:uncharacterized protein YndB with AHSA1/START domain